MSIRIAKRGAPVTWRMALRRRLPTSNSREIGMSSPIVSVAGISRLAEKPSCNSRGMKLRPEIAADSAALFKSSKHLLIKKFCNR